MNAEFIDHAAILMSPATPARSYYENEIPDGYDGLARIVLPSTRISLAGFPMLGYLWFW